MCAILNMEMTTKLSNEILAWDQGLKILVMTLCHSHSVSGYFTTTEVMTLKLGYFTTILRMTYWILRCFTSTQIMMY